MRTNFNRPERHNSLTAQGVLLINFAVVRMSCNSAGIGAGSDRTEGGTVGANFLEDMVGTLQIAAELECPATAEVRWLA
jgi:hypothetical protein